MAARGNQIPGAIRDGAQDAGQPVVRVTFKTQPVS